MIISAIIVALIATLSAWWFCTLANFTLIYPLVSGFLTGLAMGDPVMGAMCGASINLVYMGWMAPGGAQPSSIQYAGIFGTAAAIMAGSSDPAIALTFAVPFSMLGMLADQFVRTVNVVWVHAAEREAKKGNMKMVRFYNFVPSFFVVFLVYGLPAFLLVAFGGDVVSSISNAIPESLTNALSVVGGLMPALGIAMLLKFMGNKKLIAFFFAGYFMAAYMGLDTMAVTIFSVCIAVTLFFFGHQPGNASQVAAVEAEEAAALENPKARLSKKALVLHWLASYSCEATVNYERMMGLGRAYASTFLMNSLYETKEEKAGHIGKYFAFFNTEPSFIGPVIFGLEASMEEQIANGVEIKDEEFNAVRCGLMGPMAGIGDALAYGIVIPITAAIGCNMALRGSVFGPIFFFLAFTALMAVCGWVTYNLGYKQGKRAITTFLSSGILNRVIEGCSMVGLMVIGCLAFSYVTVSTPLTFTVGGYGTALQDMFDMICTGALPLAATLGTWKLLQKFKVTWVVVIMIVFSIVMSYLGVLAV
ncbi:MAG: PTS mannose transporter subunit IICD [Ruminococcus sp.]|nr:PTS mannose transporter subunit IICD [Ruminococcus sp.]